MTIHDSHTDCHAIKCTSMTIYDSHTDCHKSLRRIVMQDLLSVIPKVIQVQLIVIPALLIVIPIIIQRHFDSHEELKRQWSVFKRKEKQQKIQTLLSDQNKVSSTPKRQLLELYFPTVNDFLVCIVKSKSLKYLYL